MANIRTTNKRHKRAVIVHYDRNNTADNTPTLNVKPTKAAH